MMLEPISQLLMRRGTNIHGGNVLLYNPPADYLADELSRALHCKCSLFSSDFSNYEWFKANLVFDIPMEFGVRPAKDFG